MTQWGSARTRVQLRPKIREIVSYTRGRLLALETKKAPYRSYRSKIKGLAPYTRGLISSFSWNFFLFVLLHGTFV